MKKRLTAEQARELAGPTVDERVDDALMCIRKAAENKQRQVNLLSEFWTQGGYHKTKEWNEAGSILVALGYDVDFFYEERQLVDMYTVVRW